MGFSEKTESVEVLTVATGVVTRERDNSEGGAPFAIFVETTENGTSVNKPVPQEVVDAAWPGASKTYEDHLLDIIGTVL